MATGRLFLNEHGADEASYSYASTTDFTSFKGPNQEIHLLVTAAAPSTAHNNAPLGSLAVDKTDYKLHIHTATATWTVVGAQTA